MAGFERGSEIKCKRNPPSVGGSGPTSREVRRRSHPKHGNYVVLTMPRELRPRKTRQRYTDLFLDEGRDEQEPGPSQPPSTVPEDRGVNTTDVDDGDKGSDFAPPAPEEIALSEEEYNSDSQGARRASGSGSEGDLPTQRSSKKKRGAGPSKTTTKTKAKAKGKDKDKKAAPVQTLVPAAPARQNHTLPNPNVHHRHRPVPLFHPTAAALRVERLVRAPRLFVPNELVPTHAYASSLALTRRVGKAWGASVGAGPVWPIVEDFGWFKESADAGEEDEEEETGVGVPGGGKSTKVPLYAERVRRPRVYVGIEVHRGGTEEAGDRAPLLLCAECVFPLPDCHFSGVASFLTHLSQRRDPVLAHSTCCRPPRCPRGRCPASVL